MKRNLLIALLLCLTIGLAPFKPEPHVVGKLRWIMGGGEGMELMDYLDFAFHASPFVLLLVLLLFALFKRKKADQE